MAAKHYNNMNTDTGKKRGKIDPEMVGKGTRFSRDYQPAKRVRESLTTVFLRRITSKADFTPDLTKEQLFQSIRFLLEQCTKADLKKISESIDAPVYLVSIASAILQDIKVGRITTFQAFLDTFFGKIPDDDSSVKFNVHLYLGQTPSDLPGMITSEQDLLAWDKDFDPEKYLEMKEAQCGEWSVG